MANPNAPFGFRPHNHLSGGTPERLSEYTLSTAYATALYQGDLVKTDGSGNVVIGTAGDAAIGVFWGVKYIASDGSVVFRKNWIAATPELTGTTITALVYDDPNQLFLAQSVGSMTAADVGQLCDVSTATGGSAATGVSGQQTSATGGSEDNFKIVKVISVRDEMPCRNAAGNPDFYATGTNALVVVKIANHELGGALTAVEA
jgi:hypothetical protein